MEKKERFVVIGKVKMLDSSVAEVVLHAFESYPTDEMLEAIWYESNQRNSFTKVWFLKVEKQVRFE